MAKHVRRGLLMLLCFGVGVVSGRTTLLGTVAIGVGINLLAQIVEGIEPAVVARQLLRLVESLPRWELQRRLARQLERVPASRQRPALRVLLAVAFAAATIAGSAVGNRQSTSDRFELVTIDGDGPDSGATGIDPSGPETDLSALEAPDTTLSLEQRAELDQDVADRVVIQVGDLTESWEAFDTIEIDELQTTYLTTPGCESFAEIIGNEGVTAVAGDDVAFAAGNQAVSVIVTFYENELIAAARGPELLLDLDYRACLSTLQEDSVALTNTAGTNFVTTSQIDPVPPYGQLATALRTTTEFDLPGIDQPMSTTVRYRIQIGRAVLSVFWVGEDGNEPVQGQIVETVGSRFEAEMETYGN